MRFERENERDLETLRKEKNWRLRERRTVKPL